MVEGFRESSPILGGEGTYREFSDSSWSRFLDSFKTIFFKFET